METISPRSAKEAIRVSVAATPYHLLIDIVSKSYKMDYAPLINVTSRNKDKIWCIYFGLIPKLAWPLQMYEVSLIKVETMERIINRFIKKMFGST